MPADSSSKDSKKSPRTNTTQSLRSPKVSSPASAASAKKDPIEFGETLSDFDEDEWDTAAPAYNPEMINIKSKPNKITVFQATKTIREDPSLTSQRKRKTSKSNKGPSRKLNASPVSSTSSSVSAKTAIKSLSKSAIVEPPTKELLSKAELLGMLVTKVANLYLKGNPVEDVEVEVRLINHSKNTNHLKPI